MRNETETTTFTPGPWYAADMGNDHQGLVIAEATGANIAVTYDAKDANLIAAAPDLYEAAEIGLSWLESDHTGHGGKDLTGGDIDIIRAALAKARGEA